MRALGCSSLFFLCSALLGGCGDDAPAPDDASTPAPDAGPAYPAECENVSPMDCLLPWPSSRFLVDDATTRTGRRIAIPVEAVPRGLNDVPLDPALLARFDGFSPATSMITSFPEDVDPANLPDERHIDASLAADSPTVLLDVESGERVAHFAELDTWGDANPARRPLYLRPAVRLREARRYIVAIRALRAPGGAAIEPSTYFRALRDGTPLPEASDIEARRAHFDDIFARLESAGVARAELIQAWDFETASGESIWGDVVAMRDEALQRVATDDAPARCTVTSVQEAPAEHIFRRVHGTVRVPLFLEGVEPAADESIIHRDESGAPQFNGWADVPFVANIPETLRARVAEGGAPGPLLDYGHGLLGTRSETEDGFFRITLGQLQMVSVAIDWWGMSTPDVARLVPSLQEFSTFAATPERLSQGLVNHIVLVRSFRAIERSCADLPELSIPLAAGGTARAIDTTQSFFYGNSQGGIMGLALAGLGVDITRYALGVAGMSFSLLIPRSSNWASFAGFMKLGYPDPLQRSLIMTMGQSAWDVGEASTFAAHTISDPLPCTGDAACVDGLTPRKRLLFQIGRDDAQVANVGSDLAARTAGVEGFLSPAPYTPWGLTPLSAERDAPFAESAMVIYDIPGVPMLPLGTRDPGGPNAAHDGVRESPAAIAQIVAFLRADGAIVQTCDGICDPE